ncbi:MAG: prolipoprotein diacylglyceryl transferase [Deltaproteobacteria bacterium]|nr:MAG: prolipoprotein diacylglyceryl transferase [Deltaproteobacteria bacterium]
MLSFPQINPNIVEIGPFKLRWYGLMYVLGFLSSYLLIRRQRRARNLGLVGPRLQDLIFYLAIGLIVGARLGYILFYQFSDYLTYVHHPLEIIAIWHGGMSFHGGFIGAVLAGVLFCRRHQLPFWQTADVVIVTAPIGLGLGRLGNFINGELFGRPSSVPWAMVFPTGGPEPRHPSQLYEVALEGVLLFVVLWLLKDRVERPGTMVCLFLGGYGVLRFLAEFFRQPDPHIGLLWGFLSMGQILCLTMIITAIILWMLLPRN